MAAGGRTEPLAKPARAEREVPLMRRVTVSTLAAALLLALSATVAVAAKPIHTCPAAASGYFLVDADGWWANTVEGFEAAGIPVYEDDGTFTAEFDAFGAAFGLGDGAGLEAFVRGAQWDAFNKNDTELVCMKRRPVTPGNPPYLFNGVDDQAAKP
jgi:hypothetical protein